MNVEDLIARCRSGDDLAWEALVRRYQGRVFALAIHYLSDPEAARDAAQEVFVKVYQRLDQCRDADRFLPWLIRVTRNTCLDERRRGRRRPVEIPVDETIEIASDEPTPAEEYQQDRRRRLVHRALAMVTPRSREILALKWFGGVTEREAADALSIPLGTVKSRLNRARAELTRRVLELDGEPR